MAAAAAGIAVRAVLIGAVGLGLAELDSRVAVILAYYAVMFLLALPFLALRTPHLLVLAVAWALAAPVASHLVRRELPPYGFDDPSFGSFGDLPRLLAELGFTGVYPAVPWMAFLFLGLAIGRADLTARLLPLHLVTFGGGVALLSVVASDWLSRRPAAARAYLEVYPDGELSSLLAGGLHGTTPTTSWWWLAVHAPHSGTPFDLAHTMGCAAAVIGVCVFLARLAPRVTAIVFGAGAMTLTLYTLHVVLISDVWDEETARTYVQHAALALGVGALFALLRRRGPLELVLGLASTRVRRLLS